MATGVESFTSAGLGVYIHSESGKVGGPGMVAEDLINIMPNILKNFCNHFWQVSPKLAKILLTIESYCFEAATISGSFLRALSFHYNVGSKFQLKSCT